MSKSMHGLCNEYCADIVHMIVANGYTSIPDVLVYMQTLSLGAKRQRLVVASALEV